MPTTTDSPRGFCVCGAPMHTPTWGCVRPRLANPVDSTPQAPDELTVAECDAILAHEHELPAVCPHGRTAAERTVTPCTRELAGCVIP